MAEQQVTVGDRVFTQQPILRDHDLSLTDSLRLTLCAPSETGRFVNRSPIRLLPFPGLPVGLASTSENNRMSNGTDTVEGDPEGPAVLRSCGET
jgi:hypothetical protein